VREQPDMVRRSMGLTGQVATVDDLLTGRENIRMIGGLYGIRRRELASLSDQLLEQFSIADAGDRPVKSYSGGMRRRLDLAVSLLAGPPVLFSTSPARVLIPAAATICATCCAGWWPTAPRCCSPRSTSRRPTSWPTTSS
jgi:ABC-2 type transport system ATP-binding protein